jgi:hypothetical protein
MRAGEGGARSEETQPTGGSRAAQEHDGVADKAAIQPARGQARQSLVPDA